MPKGAGPRGALDNAIIRGRHTDEELQRVRNDLADALAESVRAKENAALIASENMAIRRERESLKNEIEARDTSLKALDAEIERLKADLAAAEELFGASDIGAIRAEAEALKAKLRQADERAEALRRQAKDAHDKVAAVEQKLAVQQNRTIAADDRARVAESKLANLQAQFKVLQAEYNKLVESSKREQSEHLLAEATIRQRHDDLSIKYDELVGKYRKLRELAKESSELNDGYQKDIDDLNAVIAQTAQDIADVKAAAEQKALDAETARRDAERAEREKQSLAGRLYKAEEELARTRRERSGKLLFSDLVALIRASSAESISVDPQTALTSGLDYQVALIGDAVLIQRRFEGGEVPQAARQAWFDSVGAAPAPTNGHAELPAHQGERQCSWCDRWLPNDSEHFPSMPTGKGMMARSSWCTECHPLRMKIYNRLENKAPDWDELGALLEQAKLICPTLSDREPYIGYWLDPSRRNGFEPKARYLLETSRNTVPFPKTYSESKARARIAESA